MEYEISPSTLKGVTDNRWGCQRCFWLKVKRGIRPPEPTGLGKLHQEIHGWQYEYLRSHWIDLLPQGKIIETELEVKAKPVNGITLWGYTDAVIELQSGGYCALDMKTTSSPEWASRNYALQLNVYAHCLMNAQEGSPSLDVRRLGILTFTGQRFGMNSPDCAGVVGRLGWHNISIERGLIGLAIGRAVEILASEALPTGRVGCEWCAFYQQLGVRF
jgi:hypothetical protein